MKVYCCWEDQLEMYVMATGDVRDEFEVDEKDGLRMIEISIAMGELSGEIDKLRIRSKIEY